MKPENTTEKHADHLHHLPRLNRAIGQLEGVKKMVQEQRACADILIQLRAIRSAIHAMEAAILEEHLDHCITHAWQSESREIQNAKLAELKQLYRNYGK